MVAILAKFESKMLSISITVNSRIESNYVYTNRKTNGKTLVVSFRNENQHYPLDSSRLK